MNTVELINGGAIVLAIALLKGDIVLGREYSRVLEELSGVSTRAAASAAEATALAVSERERSDQVIKIQAERIAALSQPRTSPPP